jgi:hypothetical protein
MAPFEIAPKLGGVLGAEKKHDQFRLRAVKLWKVDIQIWAGELGFVIFVVQHAILAEGGGKMICHLFHKGAMLARKRKGDVEAARARRIFDNSIHRD